MPKTSINRSDNFEFKMAASLHLTAIEAIVKEYVLRTGFAVRQDVYVSSTYRRVRIPFPLLQNVKCVE